MKCKICGHRANSIGAMSAHYRKKHPAAMKRRHKKSSREHGREDYHKGIKAYYPGIKYCPVCGKPLGK